MKIKNLEKALNKSLILAILFTAFYIITDLVIIKLFDYRLPLFIGDTFINSFIMFCIFWVIIAFFNWRYNK